MMRVTPRSLEWSIYRRRNPQRRKNHTMTMIRTFGRLLPLCGLALLAQPAESCHRFHTWNYPYPQRCGVIRAVVHQTPPIDDRQAAIEKLKELLK